MFAGVIRDEARLSAKREQKLRELEFEEQARKRAYLESVQAVSNPIVPPPRVDEVPTSAEGMDFSGCKTGMCDRP
jgi:protein PET117